MRKLFQKPLVLAAGIVVVIMLIPGCQEENISDTKSTVPRTRLLATRNRELKKEIRGLKKQHKNEIKAWEKRLAKCQRGKGDLEERFGKGVEKYMEAIVGPLTDENTKLFKENERLKRRIAQLVEELRKRPTIRPQPL